jgi:hypothetical protein
VVTLSPEGVKKANQAFQDGATLSGEGSAILEVDLDDVAAIARAKSPGIVFQFKAHIEAKAEKDLL